MKKIFLLLSLFVTISLSAQNYKSSVGLVVGSYNGFSYKTFVSENVALQADLGFGLLATQGSVGVVGYEGLIYGVEKHWSFYANPNLYCQKEFYNTDWGGISAFIGGISANFDSNFVDDTNADIVVVEADEFDRSFLTLHPHIAVITAMDADHLDIYGTQILSQTTFPMIGMIYISYL